MQTSPIPPAAISGSIVYDPSPVPGISLAFVAGPNYTDLFIGKAPWPVTRKPATASKTPDLGDNSFYPASWSPDGRLIAGTVALAAGGYGRNMIYDVATGATRRRSDAADGVNLVWLPDSTRVAYWGADGKLMIQDVTSLKRHAIDVKLPFPPVKRP